MGDAERVFMVSCTWPKLDNDRKVEPVDKAGTLVQDHKLGQAKGVDTDLKLVLED